MPTFAELLGEKVASGRPPASAGLELYHACVADGSDPAFDQMNEWLWERAPALFAREIKRLRSASPIPANGTKTKAVARFDEALERARRGDVGIVELTDYGLLLKVDDEGTEKALAQMTGADHRFVAARFQSVGEASAMMAALHRQVSLLLAKRDDRATTEEVMSQDQYRRLAEKVVGFQPGLRA